MHFQIIMLSHIHKLCELKLKMRKEKNNENYLKAKIHSGQGVTLDLLRLVLCHSTHVRVCVCMLRSVPPQIHKKNRIFMRTHH